MDTNNLLYQYKENKMGPFGWIFLFYIITCIFLLGVAMVLFSIEQFIQQVTIWTTLLLVLVPLGVWVTFKAISFGRTLIWKNTHLTSYQFHRKYIQLDKWDELYAKSPTSIKILLSDIEKVVLAPYIVNEYYTKHRRKIIDMNYILYIVHISKGKKELFMLPFPNKEDEINIWLTYFQERDVDVHFTNEVLYRIDRKTLTEEERLEVLEAGQRLITIAYNGSWSETKRGLHAEWNSLFPGMNYKESTLKKELDLPINKGNSTIKAIVNVTFLIYSFMLVAIFTLVKLAENAVILPDNILAPTAMLFIISFLYFFLLRNSLRWYYMIILAVKLFIFAFIASMSLAESSAIADEMGVTIAGVSILFPAIIWIPYLIAKLIKNQLDNK
jgi:hypothetical protein